MIFVNTMGIPSYFSYIIKNYSNIIRNWSMLKADSIEFQHLYMDCNSIIYDVFRGMEHIQEVDELENHLIELVIDKIREYIEFIQPSKTVFIAFDGVAPFAKMDQQRNRRYKGSMLSKISQYTNVLSDTNTWSTSNITPGTKFMQLLSDKVTQYFAEYSKKHTNIEKIIVSSSNECGEGEHKMFQYIRKYNTNKDESAAVYGLDSDLIMLSIFHCRLFQNLYIFREAPEFLKSSISISDDTEKEKKGCYFMDISRLSTSILTEMNCGVSDPQRIYDYVFLCFFLGNDFLPHFPSLNIRTNGISILMETYRRLIGHYADRFFISKDTMKIQWKWVSLFLGELAKYEHDYLISEYDLRAKWSKRKWLVGTPEERDFTFQSVPVIYRAEEEYICPSQKFWESRYYQTLFDSEYVNTNQICLNYLEGLEWVFSYYTVDCPHWRWKYKYHYPPLLRDLYKMIPSPGTQLIQPSASDLLPFTQQIQLAYVLPKANHSLLHPNTRNVVHKYSDFFPDEIDFQWTFCRYFWEAHAKLPEITLEMLEDWANEMGK